jgi:hypothetical protein
MITTALIGLIKNIFYYVVLFYVGKILNSSEQMRNFLGLNASNNEDYNYYDVTVWVEKIGNLIMVIAVLSIINAIISTGVILYNMD